MRASVGSLPSYWKLGKERGCSADETAGDEDGEDGTVPQDVKNKRDRHKIGIDRAFKLSTSFLTRNFSTPLFVR